MHVLSLCLSTFMNLQSSSPCRGRSGHRGATSACLGISPCIAKVCGRCFSSKAGRPALPEHLPARAEEHHLCCSREAAAWLATRNKTLEATLVTCFKKWLQRKNTALIEKPISSRLSPAIVWGRHTGLVLLLLS